MPLRITAHTTKIIGIAIAIALVAVLSLGAWISFAAKQSTDTSSAQTIDLRIARCDQETLEKLGASPPDFDLLQDVSGHCYNEVLGESVLYDFNLRRLAFTAQSEQAKVMLWMVVAITISGVVLAGLQLAAAFMLAASGQGGFADSSEVTISKSKISLQSSVTGLLILTISFAFFMTYVIWVYTIDPLQQGVPPPAAPQLETK